MSTTTPAAWEQDAFWREVVNLMTGGKKLRSDAYLQKLTAEELELLRGCLSSGGSFLQIRDAAPKWRGGKFDGNAPGIGTLSEIAEALRQKSLLDGLAEQMALTKAVKEREELSGLNPSLVDTVLTALSKEALQRQRNGMADGFLPKAANALLKREKLSQDDRRIAILEKKAAMADKTEQVIAGPQSAEEKQAAIKAIFGM